MYCSSNAERRGGEVEDIAQRHNRSASQILLRWAVQQGISVIPGTSNPSHMADNLAIFGFSLAEGDMSLLNGLFDREPMHLYPHHRPDKIS